MIVQSQGMFSTQSVGWIHTTTTTFWVLIPGTIVALATIVIVLMAVAQTGGEPLGERFDPTNVMHLLAASAAGGLQHLFTGTGEKDIEGVRNANIVLESIPGRGPVFVTKTV